MTQVKTTTEKHLDAISDKLHQMIKNGAIDIPKDYSVDNALRTAWFIVSDMTCKIGNDYKPVLSHVTIESVATSLFKMVTEGLNPYKNQCCFIKRKDELTYQRTYQGSIALAKRYSGVKDVRAREIHKGDKYITEVKQDGRMVLVKHEQTLESMSTDIIGGYCIIIDKDGNENLTQMPLAQIRKAWSQGSMKGAGDVHKNFEDEMVKKTVINRACKQYINSSDDESIVSNIDMDTDGSEDINTKRIELGMNESKETKQLSIPEEKEDVKSEKQDTNQDEAPY